MREARFGARDSGRVIVGSIAVLEAIESLFPERPLYPSDPSGARVRLFIEWFEHAWKPTAAAIEDEIVDYAPKPRADRIAELRARLIVSLRLFEGLLHGGDFLFGNRLTAADCVAFPFVKYASLGLSPGDEKLFHRILVDHQPLGDDHPRLRAWIRRVDTLPRA